MCKHLVLSSKRDSLYRYAFEEVIKITLLSQVIHLAIETEAVSVTDSAVTFAGYKCFGAQVFSYPLHTRVVLKWTSLMIHPALAILFK